MATPIEAGFGVEHSFVDFVAKLTEEGAIDLSVGWGGCGERVGVGYCRGEEEESGLHL
jgi:hypothetical protein